MKAVFFLLISLPAFSQSKTLPNFKFSRLDGEGIFTDRNVPLGKQSLFVFFDVTCPHCQEAMAGFDKNWKKLSQISVYLVTLDNKAQVKTFLSQYGKNLYSQKNVTVLLDTYNEFIAKFQPIKYPSMLLYSSNKSLELYSHEPKDVKTFLRLVK